MHDIELPSLWKERVPRPEKIMHTWSASWNACIKRIAFVIYADVTKEERRKEKKIREIPQ